jgi:hypothetical protein
MSIEKKLTIKQFITGNLTNKYGQIWYNGKYEKNTLKPNGLGKRFYSNGDSLVGEFKDGNPSNGCLYVFKERKSYIGSFVGGFLEGEVKEKEEDDD